MKLSGNYCTNTCLLLIDIMLCGKLNRQIVFRLKLLYYRIAGSQVLDETRARVSFVFVRPHTQIAVECTPAGGQGHHSGFIGNLFDRMVIRIR